MADRIDDLHGLYKAARENWRQLEEEIPFNVFFGDLIHRISVDRISERQYIEMWKLEANPCEH